MNTAELKKLAEDATPGPWRVTGSMTKYIEASIGNGWIQEVCAVGPTEADNGYGPQQEANAKLIAAANPDAILKLLAINAELVEALKKATPHINPKAIDGEMVQNHPMEDCYINTIAMAALAKAEGGEL